LSTKSSNLPNAQPWPYLFAPVTTASGTERHAGWVRISHGIVTVSLATLAFSGSVILMAHPRLYWGNAGNDLTPALIELPITPAFEVSARHLPKLLTTSSLRRIIEPREPNAALEDAEDNLRCNANMQSGGEPWR
jgi:hypothetical protein